MRSFPALGVGGTLGVVAELGLVLKVLVHQGNGQLTADKLALPGHGDGLAQGAGQAVQTRRGAGMEQVAVHGLGQGQAVFDALSPRFGQVERPLAEAVAGNPRLASPLKANPRRAAFFAAFAALPFAEVEKRFLALPSLPYRAAAKVLTPAMKEKIRKLLK